METVPAWTHQHATELRDHWWWRPGWRVGTRFYAWHITFNEGPDLHRLVERYQAALAPHPGFDPVPQQWLHLTMQGVGHVEDVTPAQCRGLLEAARHELAGIGPLSAQFHKPVIRPEAIALPAMPPANVDRIRRAVRTAIAAALGPARLTEHADGFQPHVTVAYSTTTQSAGPYASLLEAVDVRPVDIAIGAMSLIEMHRDHRMYEWQTVGTAQITD